jgi:arylsulfatase A
VNECITKANRFLLVATAVGKVIESDAEKLRPVTKSDRTRRRFNTRYAKAKPMNIHQLFLTTKQIRFRHEKSASLVRKLRIAHLVGFVLPFVGIGAAFGQGRVAPANRPNIVFILADDLGYGDVGSFNPESKIKTPRIDRLASQGMKFTDAHSASAVCTPSRYAILTGRYAWRTRLKQGVLGGFSPPLIQADRLTVAELLKKQGYHTACFGKWHLGLDWPVKSPVVFGDEIVPKGDYRPVDYTRPITNGPNERGFKTYFGISASLDMYPFVFINNDRTVGVPTVEKTFVRKGPAAADFEAVDVARTITNKAIEYIHERSTDPDRPPFFLYFALSAPHAPIVPEHAYINRNGIGPYGDFVEQVDDEIGEVLDALDRGGLAENTLVIVTSDNGCSPVANLDSLAKHGHHPGYHFRGAKADIFEGGHRIPFVVRWPGKVRAGSVCDQTICQVDFMATCAEILGVKLDDHAGEDSFGILPYLIGATDRPIREATIHHSINGSFAIRQGPWKLALCPDSGGWSKPRPGRDDATNLPPIQLYDLSRDVGEQNNLQADRPDVVDRLIKLLERYVADGRSAPGKPQPNDAPIQLPTIVRRTLK